MHDCVAELSHQFALTPVLKCSSFYRLCSAGTTKMCHLLSLHMNAPCWKLLCWTSGTAGHNTMWCTCDKRKNTHISTMECTEVLGDVSCPRKVFEENVQDFEITIDSRVYSQTCWSVETTRSSKANTAAEAFHVISSCHLASKPMCGQTHIHGLGRICSSSNSVELSMSVKRACGKLFSSKHHNKTMSVLSCALMMWHQSLNWYSKAGRGRADLATLRWALYWLGYVAISVASYFRLHECL